MAMVKKCISFDLPFLADCKKGEERSKTSGKAWTRRSNKADEKRRKLKLRELKSYKTSGERKEKNVVITD